jgi:hypothetical protein
MLGILINEKEREYLCNQDGNIIIFANEIEASQFLVENGAKPYDFVNITFPIVCNKCHEPLAEDGSCPNILSHNSDDPAW